MPSERITPEALADDPRALNDCETFILELGRALHATGATAQWLEARLPAVGSTCSVEVRVFSSPTMLIVGFGSLATQKQRVLRITPRPLDIGRFAAVDEVAAAVESGVMSAPDGIERLHAALDTPARFGPIVSVIAFGMAGCAVGRFFSSDLLDVVAALAIGLLVGAICEGGTRSRRLSLTVAPISAAIAAFCAVAIDRTIMPINELAVTIAALIVLVPGYGITSAIDELATRNLVSGAARFAEAVALLVTLGFGMAVGRAIGGTLPQLAPVLPGLALPSWTEVPALVLATLGLALLVHSRRRDLPATVLVGAMAFYAARGGTAVLGPELGAFAGAFVAGIASNLVGRWRTQPSVITAIPALILLVPGSIGFRGVAALLDKDVIPGVEAAFATLLIAVAIVVGGLLASAALPDRRSWTDRELD